MLADTRPQRAESRCGSASCRFRQRRVQQRRVPHPPASIASEQSFSLPKQARFFLRKSSSAISGFRSLCGRKQRSSVGHRAQFDLRFGTFSPGAALAMRTLTITLAFTRRTTGPAPMLCPERSRSRGIFQEVFCAPIGLLWRHFSARYRPRDACQISFWRAFRN